MIHILSLDDEPEMLKLLGLILELCGYRHTTTTESAEALEIMRCEPVDLFTQDCMRPLPNMHGVELYKLMKADPDLACIPVIFVTAGRRPEFAAVCRSRYGDEYITKPFGPSELLATVERVLDRSGKSPPTEKERAAHYQQNRTRLAKVLRMKLADLDASYERTSGWLRKLGEESRPGIDPPTGENI